MDWVYLAQGRDKLLGILLRIFRFQYGEALG